MDRRISKRVSERVEQEQKERSEGRVNEKESRYEKGPTRVRAIKEKATETDEKRGIEKEGNKRSNADKETEMRKIACTQRSKDKRI